MRVLVSSLSVLGVLVFKTPRQAGVSGLPKEVEKKVGEKVRKKVAVALMANFPYHVKLNRISGSMSASH